MGLGCCTHPCVWSVRAQNRTPISRDAGLFLPPQKQGRPELSPPSGPLIVAPFCWQQPAASGFLTASQRARWKTPVPARP